MPDLERGPHVPLAGPEWGGQWFNQEEEPRSPTQGQVESHSCHMKEQ